MNFPKLYECDPQKNTECNKRNCGNPCKYTTRKEFSREPSEKMTPELAFMVLDATRRERCEDTPRTRAACNVAQGALYLQMKASPYPDGDENVLACQNCKSGEYLYNEDGNRCCFCGWCGQAIDWNAETFKAAGQMKPVLKYPGSKWRLAEWIVSLMPPHKSYLEPFFGSGAVFFKKPPSRIETINDLDGEIINLFRCIREQPEELMRAVTDPDHLKNLCAEFGIAVG